MATVNNTLLKLGITKMRESGAIDIATETAAEAFIDDISKNTYSILGYDSFDQAASVDFTYTDTTRTATNSSAGDATLATSYQSLADCILRGILVDTSDAISLYEISTDGTNYFSVDNFNSNETLTSTTKFRVTLADSSIVYNIMIIYDKEES